MSRTQETRALLLDTHPYRDADLVVRLFLAERGNVSAMARSARASRRRFPSGLDRLTLADVRISASRTGRGMPTLEGAEVAEVWWNIRSDLGKVAAASLLAELLLKAHVEPDEATLLFDFACALLNRLDAAPGPCGPAAALLAAGGILHRLHLLPQPLRCSGCSLPRLSAPGTSTPPFPSEAWLDPATGELLCSSHAEHHAGRIRLEEHELQLLALTAGAPAEWPLAPEVSPIALPLLARLEPFLTRLFGSNLRSLAFLGDVA